MTNVLWTALQSALIWGVALFLVPLLIVALEHRFGGHPLSWPAAPVAAVILFLLCSALNLAAGFELAVRGEGTPLPTAGPRKLVVGGVYRYVRNPMAIAGIGQGIAVGLWFGSWLVLIYAFAGAFVWHYGVRPAEEQDLLARFGEAYAHYRIAVPLWRGRSTQ
ncbi:MAG TPA: isoprenylcysteine carboxylmethyltransferase family protein [Polyangiaceae bacterium]